MPNLHVDDKLLLNNIKVQRRHHAYNWEYLLSILSKKPDTATQLRLFVCPLCDGDLQISLLPLIRGDEDMLPSLDCMDSSAIAYERNVHANNEVCRISTMNTSPEVFATRNAIHLSQLNIAVSVVHFSYFRTACHWYLPIDIQQSIDCAIQTISKTGSASLSET
ncbi:hypothetical protein BC943DRAFT_357528 [Umbelopsis sp. AD052]|nr:hypothetical protein BC943DRAFT_357528 [Umbelopsis sp. AD052]